MLFVVDRFAACPPLTMDEIEALAGWAAGGEAWTEEEEARVARQCPLIQGELLITAIRGAVFVKRYPGIDLALI
jgi:hypothetical protein